MALSLSPRIPQAEGFRLSDTVGGLPMPQFVLRTLGSGFSVVPLQHGWQPALVCTVEVESGSTAFQVAYAASQACASLRTAHNQLARRTAHLVAGGRRMEPFAESCIVTHAAVSLFGHSSAFRLPMRAATARGSDRPPRVLMPRAPDLRDITLADDTPGLQVLCARHEPVWISTDVTMTLGDLTVLARRALPSADGAAAFWPLLRPAFPNLTPLLLVVPKHRLIESRQWVILDIRRLSPQPPLHSLQVIPSPEYLTDTLAADLIRGEFPTLGQMACIYHNDAILDAHPRPVAMADVITVVARPQRHPSVPVLDDNLGLLQALPGVRIALHRFLPPAGTHRSPPASPAAGAVPSGASSIADTDASASFLDYFSRDTDPEDDEAISDPPWGERPAVRTTTTTTTCARVATAVSGSSTTTTTWTLPRVTFFASAGGCRPLQLHTSGTCHLHQIIATTTGFCPLMLPFSFPRGFLTYRIEGRVSFL